MPTCIVRVPGFVAQEKKEQLVVASEIDARNGGRQPPRGRVDGFELCVHCNSSCPADADAGYWWLVKWPSGGCGPTMAKCRGSTKYSTIYGCAVGHIVVFFFAAIWKIHKHTWLRFAKRNRGDDNRNCRTKCMSDQSPHKRTPTTNQG